MSDADVSKLHSMTGEQIAQWCARNRKMVVIEYHRDHEGFVHPIIRAHGEPSLNIDVAAQVRRQGI